MRREACADGHAPFANEGGIRPARRAWLAKAPETAPTPRPDSTCGGRGWLKFRPPDAISSEPIGSTVRKVAARREIGLGKAADRAGPPWGIV